MFYRSHAQSERPLDTRKGSLRAIAFAISLLACAAILAGCSDNSSRQEDTAEEQAFPSLAQANSDTPETEDTSSARDSQNTANAEGEEGAEQATTTVYPTGWLISEVDGIPRGEPVQLLHLPDLTISAHSNGAEVPANEQKRLDGLDDELAERGNDSALISYDGAIVSIDPGMLLVNLPDVMPEADYDIVYSYSSTSRCEGQAIPGVTGEHLPGYADGKQPSAYWAEQQFVVPCAYQTALKAKQAATKLEESGYRLLVYDAYRPMQTQRYLSDAFLSAYETDPIIQNSLGAWSLDWYVASGSSGHNFGTDLDVGLHDALGNLVTMPSSFDAFDETGHLTTSPMNSAAITPDFYCDAVSLNTACCALHAAFTEAGFSELASEWWHFGDEETESANRTAVGDGGLDFIARLPEREEAREAREG